MAFHHILIIADIEGSSGCGGYQASFPIDKSIPPEMLDAHRWRKDLARATAESLGNMSVRPYLPDGPFHAEIAIRDGADAAAKMADPWGFKRSGATVTIDAPDIHGLYHSLIRLCYLPPIAEKTLPLSLVLFNLIGRLGQSWVRRQIDSTLTPGPPSSIPPSVTGAAGVDRQHTGP